MGEIKNIVLNILNVVVDIFLLGIKAIKQLVLPGRNKSGNLISSLLIFFIDLVERLSLFQHGSMTNIFNFKYLRRTVVLIAGTLFILASFECTFQPHYDTSNQENQTETLVASTTSKKAVVQPGNILQYQPYKYFLITAEPLASFTLSSPLKKYLLTHSLLI